MARMPDVAADILRDGGEAADALRRLMHPHLMHHRHDAPQPAVTAPQPVIPHNGTQEEPMSVQVLDEIADHIRQAAAKFEQLDREAQVKLAAVQANPATAEIFTIIGQLTHLPPTSLATGLEVLKMTLAAAGGQAPASISGDAQPAPAGPQVGGQA